MITKYCDVCMRKTRHNVRTVIMKDPVTGRDRVTYEIVCLEHKS